nr:hypothetical protein [Tanacetum cinerariifolium]
MAKKDEEKMAFHAEEEVFCYIKMPFGLKNVKETYQKLVDTIFEKQTGRNLEAYVDDMVIKTERALPCLDTLKNCTNKKDFHWTTEAEEAFQAMKKLIAELPTLTAPKKEEELMVYLSAANEVVSAILLVEREGRQASIHYVSITLEGLRIATNIKVEKMHAFIDSKLVSNQVEGSYKAKGEKTKKYKEKVEEIIRSFSNFRISHIPREENKKADALSKLAADIIEFRDSYEAPKEDAATTSASDSFAKKKRRTVAVTTEDMQKRKKDAAILKTFGGNEATEKMKKNLLKYQYGNFKAEGTKHKSRLLIDCRSDLDTMSLDDLYNHLKVYESEVQKKSKSNSQNMAFISSAKNNSGKEEVNIASVPTASTNVSPASVNIRAVNINENHALVAEEEAPTEFALMAKTSDESEVEELLTKEKGELDTKLTGFQIASKNLDNLLESQRSDKNKEGLGYSDVPPPPAQVYSPPKKDMSWTGLPEFADDTITDYTRPSPSVESNPNDLQSSSSSASENGESTGSILSKPEIKFVRPADSPTVVKSDKKEIVRKSSVKYAKLYRKPTKRSNVRGNQRNWNNLKSQQLGNNFVMKKACYNYGGIDH